MKTLHLFYQENYSGNKDSLGLNVGVALTFNIPLDKRFQNACLKSATTQEKIQQQILSNDLYNDTDNSGIDKWIQDAVDGKVSNCWKRMQREWTDKLINDSSFTDPIPSNQADFVALVTARSDYKNRKARDDA